MSDVETSLVGACHRGQQRLPVFVPSAGNLDYPGNILARAAVLVATAMFASDKTCKCLKKSNVQKR